MNQTNTIPCMRSNFSQSLDRTRPSVLVTPGKIAQKQHQLEYRYTDTDEIVLVPNIWYNQTVAMRVGFYRFCVKREFEYAEQLKKSPPVDTEPEVIEREIAYAHERAAALEAVAEGMEKSGIVTA